MCCLTQGGANLENAILQGANLGDNGALFRCASFALRVLHQRVCSLFVSLCLCLSLSLPSLFRRRWRAREFGIGESEKQQTRRCHHERFEFSLVSWRSELVAMLGCVRARLCCLRCVMCLLSRSCNFKGANLSNADLSRSDLAGPRKYLFYSC